MSIILMVLRCQEVKMQSIMLTELLLIGVTWYGFQFQNPTVSVDIVNDPKFTHKLKIFN